MTQEEWVYHVTTPKKYQRYQKSGCIMPPVRAWEKMEDALDFSFRTGRTIILRLKLPNKLRLFGHKGKAVYYEGPLHLPDHEVRVD